VVASTLSGPPMLRRARDEALLLAARLREAVDSLHSRAASIIEPSSKPPRR
jgi:hypothetical protein